MDKFLDQFNLTGLQRVDFESFIFAQADKMLPGYSGGMWESRNVGGAIVLMIPEHLGENGRFTLDNYLFGGSMTTDHLTASVAFTSMVTNWYWNARMEQGRLKSEQHNAFMEVYEDFGDAIYKARKVEGIDYAAYSRFID